MGWAKQMCVCESCGHRELLSETIARGACGKCGKHDVRALAPSVPPPRVAPPPEKPS